MVNIPFSQLSIAVTLLNSASQQIEDAANYLEYAGEAPSSRELYALGSRTQRAIAEIEKKVRKIKSTGKEESS